MAHVIVLGNEKGGSGKSTTAMHLIVGLLRLGVSVASIDLDLRQRTLTRYVENRRASRDQGGLALAVPAHRTCPESTPEAEAAWLEETVTALGEQYPVLVIDCPGNAGPLSRLGHTFADTLVTPLNDSFIDLDVLARIEPDSLRIQRPSQYAEMVWEQRKQRAARGRASIDWIVMRNRLSMLNARNKQDMEAVLATLAGRIGFRLAPGFGERVVYRELFLKGLTMMDVREAGEGTALTMSHVAARQEVRGLIDAIGFREEA